MNITFFLGNGFDIGIGLKTRYEDFYKEYCKISGKDNDNIQSFKTMLSKCNSDELKKIIDWSDFEKAFGQHSKDFDIKSKNLYLERFENFVEAFNAYLEKEEINIDFTDTEAISKIMFDAITKYYHIRTESKEAISQIYNKLSFPLYYNFVSFNYTHSVDKCVECLSTKIKSDNNRRIGRVIHIHGYIEKNMILGVNDPSQITNEDLASDYEIIQEIVKPAQNSYAKANYEKDLMGTINSSDIICVYGMSIGETDKKWWRAISEWLSKSANRALVILKYDNNYDERFVFRQRKFIDPIISNFLKLSEQPVEIAEKIKDRIYVEMNYNIFGMNLRKESNSKEEN